jgi:hypothetical protein
MPLNPEIAEAILDAKVSIYAQNFFAQRDFEDPTVFVRSFQPDRKPINHVPPSKDNYSFIEVEVSTLDENTIVDEVKEFCETQRDLMILSIKPHGLIGRKVTIVLV